MEIKINDIVLNVKDEVALQITQLLSSAIEDKVKTDSGRVQKYENECFGFSFNPETNEVIPIGLNRSYTPVSYLKRTNKFHYGDWEQFIYSVCKFRNIINTKLNTNDEMVMFSKLYFYIYFENNLIYVWINNMKIDDNFKCWAHIDLNSNEVNYFLVPRYKGFIKDGIMRSIPNVKPTVETTFEEEIKAVRIKGEGWQIWDVNMHQYITILLMLISNSADFKEVFGNGIVDRFCMFNTSQTNSYFKRDDDNKGGRITVFGIQDFWGNRWDRCLGHKKSESIDLVYTPIREEEMIPYPALRCAQFGGSWHIGYWEGGPFYWYLNNSASYKSLYTGASCCYRPQLKKGD